MTTTVTPTDSELLAKVRSWARDNGWRDTNLGWVNPDETVRVREADRETGIDIWWRTSAGNWQMFPTPIRATSVRQAVDLLVAYGILPVRFSSLADTMLRLADELESEGSTDQLDSAYRIRLVLDGEYEPTGDPR